MREFIVRKALRQLACLAFAGILALPLYLVTPSSLRAQTGQIFGQVAGIPRVVDGDTIVINNIRIRLEGIDAPESTQTCGVDPRLLPARQSAPPFGNPNMLGNPPLILATPAESWACGTEATRHLARLIGHAEVRCEDLGPDRYGRTLGRCFVGNVNVNAAMVRDGYAWAYVKYSKDYVGHEGEARAARRGIWQGDAIPAWDYRRRAWETAEVTAPAGCTIKGNVNASGKIYHMPWNTWYDKVKMEPGRANAPGGLAGGKRWFCNELEAQAAGWRPAMTR
jgi:endonuclease YncB( thermonuclease family)